MNDNQKSTRNHNEVRPTGNTDGIEPHKGKEQLSSGASAKKTSVQAAAATHKKIKRDSRPRPLL